MAANRLYSSGWLRLTVFLRARFFLRAIMLLWAIMFCANAAQAQKRPSVFDDEVFQKPFAESSLEECEACNSDAAAFDTWESVVEDDAAMHWDQPAIKPFDWFRHFGFRHSSTHGRHIGLGIPLEKTSWKNRPYHIDWFTGTLLGDNLISKRVAQDNELFGGLRIGWDFDHYWGIETRFGWSDPNIQTAQAQTSGENGSYFVSDIDILYYPWGDSKIRPYILLGVGMAQFRFIDDVGVSVNNTLVTTPFGLGIQFQQWSWLAWRFELLNNIAYGADGMDTVDNISLTAGMEFRFGARPASYWPWQSSRRIW